MRPARPPRALLAALVALVALGHGARALADPVVVAAAPPRRVVVRRAAPRVAPASRQQRTPAARLALVFDRRAGLYVPTGWVAPSPPPARPRRAARGGVVFDPRTALYVYDGDDDGAAAAARAPSRRAFTPFHRVVRDPSTGLLIPSFLLEPPAPARPRPRARRRAAP